jgi:hypothetical protein
MAGVASADKVRTDYDHTADLTKYRTFRWIQRPDTDQPFMQERIMTSVNAQLVSRGFEAAKDEADLAIGANFATEEKHTWETYYNGDGGWGWGWGGGWATTTERTYEVGTLIVSLFDTQSKKLVWQGVAVDDLSSHAEKRTKDLSKQLVKMFKDFPLRVAQ